MRDYPFCYKMMLTVDVFCYFYFLNWQDKELAALFFSLYKNILGDFPGGTVVKNLPANAGGTGLSPGLGRFHMLQSN